MTTFLYHVSQRVLCYEPDESKKRVLYHAKVLGTRIGESGQNEYRIHFQGWKSKWDRWAAENLIMEVTEETLKILAIEGKQTKKQQAEEAAARAAQREAQRAAAKLAAVAAAASNVSKFETPSKVVKPSSSTPSERKISRESHLRKKVACPRRSSQAKNPHLLMDEPYLSSAAPSPGSVQTETSVEEQTLSLYHMPYSKKRRPLKFDISSMLIKEIAEDMIKIKEEKKLHKLPCSISVAQILENSVRNFACSQANLPSTVKSKYECEENYGRENEPEKKLSLYEEFVDSINRMFNAYLPSLSLLYAEEIEQYKNLCQRLKFPPLKSLEKQTNKGSTKNIRTPSSLYIVEIRNPDSQTADNLTNGNETSDTLQQEDAEVEKVAVKEARKDGKRAYPDNMLSKTTAKESAKRSRRDVDHRASSTVNTTTTHKTSTKRSRGSSRRTKKRRQVFNNLDLNHKSTTSSPRRRSAEQLSIEDSGYILTDEEVGQTGSANDEHGRRRSNRIQSPTRLSMITEDQTTAEVAGCSTNSERIQSPHQQPCHSHDKDVIDMTMKVFIRPPRYHDHRKSVMETELVQRYCKNSPHACKPTLPSNITCKNNYISKAGRDATKAACLNSAWEFSLYPRHKDFSERLNGQVPPSMIYGFHHFIRFLDKFHVLIPYLGLSPEKVRLISDMFKFLNKFVNEYVKELMEYSDYLNTVD